MANPFETRGAMLRSFDAGTPLVIEPVRLRSLKPDEVLIKIAASPINPSDLVFLRNRYGIHKRLPVVPGFEGAGTVIDAGTDVKARKLISRHVACHASTEGHGTWAKHMIARVEQCVVLHKDISLEEGASLFVNPLTAWALIAETRRAKAKAFVATAAYGALGKMLLRLGKRFGLEGIAVVRKPEQAVALRKLGAKFALCSESPGFDGELHKACRGAGATIALDAVGGRLSAQVASALMPGGRVVVYGALSGSNCEIGPSSLIFDDQRLEGFWVTKWIKRLSEGARKRTLDQVQMHLKSDLYTAVQARLPLSKVNEALTLYKGRRNEGKVLIVPTKEG